MAQRSKRRTNAVGIIPKDVVIVRLAGSQLMEQQEERQLESLLFFSEATMAKIPEPEDYYQFNRNISSPAINTELPNN